MNKLELEALVKKLKEELRELRKEVKVQSEVELPDKSFCVIKEGKEFAVLDLELNLETEDVKITQRYCLHAEQLPKEAAVVFSHQFLEGIW